MAARKDTSALLFADALDPKARLAAPGGRFELYADVAVNRPVRCEFTYGVPEELRAVARPGVRVAVMLGGKREVGVVTGLRVEPGVDVAKIRPLARVLDEAPLLEPDLLELTRWIASTYACSWGEALAAALPGAFKGETSARTVATVSVATGKGTADLVALEAKDPKQHRLLRTLIEIGAPIEVREICRRVQLSASVVASLARKGLVVVDRRAARTDPLLAAIDARPRPEVLSADQAVALDAISKEQRAGRHATFLLQGVTGSGKTEVYLRAIETALELGLGAIVLVPEIALTPQTVGWFRSRFGEVAVLHSRMTDAQRRDTWLRVQRGDVRVVVGARSAVFAPVRKLGVVVVDEEHEPSFKQDGAPRYHGRDVAAMRAKLQGAVCILGSATPSLETWTASREGRIARLLLRQRVGGGRMPRVEIVDLRTEKPEGKGPVLFSRRLQHLLRGALERKEQSILFLNRRGFAPVLWCAACGETVRCGMCDVTLTFHRRIRRAVCHSCCTEIAPPAACPSCTAPGLRYLGAGSERIETELAKLLPGARIRRMDSDTMIRREDYETTLDSFGRGEIDVLVGTQMIAKGLDFPRVTVVGIVSADSSLHLPDFRAAERTFQLLSQVAGRAGRGELAGEIVVQTTSPAHPAILTAARHDFEAFAAAESRLRAELGYPPHGRLLRVVVEDKDETKVVETSRACAELVRRLPDATGVAVLGPAEAPIAMVRGRHRHHVLVKSPIGDAGFDAAREALRKFADSTQRPRVILDVDPASML
ncbi:MAG TPA: primosomal protein N' [Planctomycetota bacterium]|jgi:primosomal protein N' (replication factor Y)|nr:primosomal protein N' [Planctomycetota bacterium]